MTVEINGQPKPAQLILPPDDLQWKLAMRRYELQQDALMQLDVERALYGGGAGRAA